MIRLGPRSRSVQLQANQSTTLFPHAQKIGSRLDTSGATLQGRVLPLLLMIVPKPVASDKGFQGVRQTHHFELLVCSSMTVLRIVILR
ncbi:hypothetical protein RPC_1628 [Rhodopseudomonas palustris BisB18]|uniref:Uncharacterized protein n=1 Tax=Rhodopseudomonas palustris (strain BisB18) TaxID=316056 RepID=Q218J6_RHOPB